MLRGIHGFPVGLFPTLFAQAAPAKSSGVWLEVPYVKQTKTARSAAIAMLLQYWSGITRSLPAADATAIQKQLYRERRAAFSLECALLRESGFREFAMRGKWSDLPEHLSKAGR